MGLFGKSDVIVKCYDTDELGRLLNWLRQEHGLSALSLNRFTVKVEIEGQLGWNPEKVRYFEVAVPHYLYARLREKYLKEVVLSEAILQEEIFKEITQP